MLHAQDKKQQMQDVTDIIAMAEMVTEYILKRIKKQTSKVYDLRIAKIIINPKSVDEEITTGRTAKITNQPTE